MEMAQADLTQSIEDLIEGLDAIYRGTRRSSQRDTFPDKFRLLQHLLVVLNGLRSFERTFRDLKLFTYDEELRLCLEDCKTHFKTIATEERPRHQLTRMANRGVQRLAGTFAAFHHHRHESFKDRVLSQIRQVLLFIVQFGL